MMVMIEWWLWWLDDDCGDWMMIVVILLLINFMAVRGFWFASSSFSVRGDLLAKCANSQLDHDALPPKSGWVWFGKHLQVGGIWEVVFGGRWGPQWAHPQWENTTNSRARPDWLRCCPTPQFARCRSWSMSRKRKPDGFLSDVAQKWRKKLHFEKSGQSFDWGKSSIIVVDWSLWRRNRWKLHFLFSLLSSLYLKRRGWLVF